MEENQKNVIGMIAMILGIASLVLWLCGCCVGVIPVVGKIFAWLLIVLRIAMSVAAIIMGIVGAKKNPEKKGMAVAGIILGSVGSVIAVLNLVLSIIFTILGTAGNVLLNTNPQMINDLLDSLDINY